MSIEVRQRLTQDLLTKAGIMKKRIDEGTVESSRHPLVTKIYQFVYRQFVSSFSVEGIENLEKAKEWAEGEEKRLIFTPRHESDFDNPTIRYVFDQLGYSGISNNTLWIAGVNMDKRPYIKPFMRAEHIVYIATPYDLSEIRRLLAEGQLEVEEREQLEKAQATFIEMNKIALTKAKESARRKEHLVLYPEAGRSYDGLMKKAPREVSVYFPRGDNAVIVPIKMFGPKEINPPNKFIRLKKLIPGFRQHIRMVVGEPYLSSEVWQWKNFCEKQLGKDYEIWQSRREWGDGGPYPADWVMANIANTDGHDIRPGESKFYHVILPTFRPQRSKFDPKEFEQVA